MRRGRVGRDVQDAPGLQPRWEAVGQRQALPIRDERQNLDDLLRSQDVERNQGRQDHPYRLEKYGSGAWDDVLRVRAGESRGRLGLRRQDYLDSRDAVVGRLEYGSCRAAAVARHRRAVDRFEA